jgi:very-short-patch-repair endonuclease
LNVPFGVQISACGLPCPVQEFVFHPTRRWRFDWAFPDWHVAVEQDGGTWSGGRHVRGKGFEEDARKTNHAAIAGWLVLRVTTAMVRTGEALTLLEAALRSRGWR